MDGKKYFKQCCQELGIDSAKFVQLGSGRTNNGTSYKFHPSTKRIDSHIYAIKYIEPDDIYIAWNLNDHILKGYDTFTLNKKFVDEISDKKIYGINAPVEYPGKDREETLVFVFKPQMTTSFLKAYILPVAKQKQEESK